MANNIAYQIILSSRAEKEIETSWTWYEERQQGLGDRLVTETIYRLRQIEQTPERYSIRYKNYRETKIEVFPFVIIYKINKKKKLIYVVSIFHASRNPKRKYKK
jgi:plasmid stabilization system protein ParE